MTFLKASCLFSIYRTIFHGRQNAALKVTVSSSESIKN
ncbi:hypothetical protein CHCC20488_3255 [Bacillus paralicheniformis]|nr:hypothetical protein CHCC20497_3062 [Bacillus paralicheniformis]TWK88012.1 hypothetical protein CHCC20333_3070 [Bacillus paralicheniformis]TWN39643.1 hypothetical protein CHCC14523_4617 [Bacillus paralicheniformis]TWN81856.1 hypothetical protein CHCC20492_3629 [Bacillus paralicheniformis]TWN99427.1 hypothetical protein CHCC20488_3255 [Bacillus paralicheniformis]